MIITAPSSEAPGSSDRVPIEAGARIRVRNAAGESDTLVVQTVQQRLWSRIGKGQLRGQDIFLKQILDVQGSWSPQQYKYECSGLELASGVLGERVQVPSPKALDEDNLILVLEDLALESMDELLRRSPAAFERAIPPTLERVVLVLDELAAAEVPQPLQATLHTKRRAYGGDPTSLFFKGLELRNMGFSSDSMAYGGHELVLFDLGRPFLTSPEDAAGRVFLSIGLLNWGRPFRRFVQGPNLDLLATAKDALGTRLDREAVASLLQKERRQRLEEVRAGGVLHGFAKSLALPWVGARYFDRLERWCADHL